MCPILNRSSAGGTENQKLDRQKDREKYMQLPKKMRGDLESALKFHGAALKEIENYFADDLKNQTQIPEVENPGRPSTSLTRKYEVFNKTIELIARNPVRALHAHAHYKGEDNGSVGNTVPKNMGRFMKILLIKRLESSFYAFRNTLTALSHTMTYSSKD